MRSGTGMFQKIYSKEEIERQVQRWRLKSKKIAFTNGVFDILHNGHIDSLKEAAAFADVLIVGINSDASVKRLKGDSRPVNTETARANVMSALLMVESIVIFEEDTPLELIKSIMPDVLIKGGDYTLDQIVGAKEVMENGGEVKIVPITEGYSTTGIIEKMRTN